MDNNSRMFAVLLVVSMASICTPSTAPAASAAPAAPATPADRWLTIHQLNGVGNHASIFQAALALANATNRHLALPMLLSHAALRWPWKNSDWQYRSEELASCQRKNARALNGGMAYFKQRANTTPSPLQWGNVWDLDPALSPP